MYVIFADCRLLSSLPDRAEVPAEVEKPKISGRRLQSHNPILEYRHVYPEFLPDPNPKWRNALREKLERADMLKRRSQIDLPEFYVGKLMINTIK